MFSSSIGYVNYRVTEPVHINYGQTIFRDDNSSLEVVGGDYFKLVANQTEHDMAFKFQFPIFGDKCYTINFSVILDKWDGDEVSFWVRDYDGFGRNHEVKMWDAYLGPYEGNSKIVTFSVRTSEIGYKIGLPNFGPGLIPSEFQEGYLCLFLKSYEGGEPLGYTLNSLRLDYYDEEVNPEPYDIQTNVRNVDLESEYDKIKALDMIVYDYVDGWLIDQKDITGYDLEKVAELFPEAVEERISTCDAFVDRKVIFVRDTLPIQNAESATVRCLMKKVEALEQKIEKLTNDRFLE
jgi:hypothetical protein